jgi:hypothetical protein
LLSCVRNKRITSFRLPSSQVAINEKIISAALLLAAFASAHAETFNFSYTFADGPAVTGSLTGHLVGDLVEGVSNIHVSFNGTDFARPSVGASWTRHA